MGYKVLSAALLVLTKARRLEERLECVPLDMVMHVEEQRPTTVVPQKLCLCWACQGRANGQGQEGLCHLRVTPSVGGVYSHSRTKACLLLIHPAIVSSRPTVRADTGLLVSSSKECVPPFTHSLLRLEQRLS